MAEPDYNTPSWGPVSSRPGVQNADMSAPMLSAHAVPFPQPFHPLSYDAPYGPISNPLMSPFPGLSNGLFSNQTPARSPYALDGGHHMYPPTPPLLYPYVPAHPRPPPAFRNGPVNQRADLGVQPEANDWYARTENPMLHAPQPFFPPFRQSYEGPVVSPSGPSPLARRQHYMGMNPPPRYLGQEAARGGGGGGGGAHGGVPDQPRPVQSHNRRASYQDHYQHHNRAYDNAERRSSMLLAAQNRRSDRSVSPRTSNRRSFDRYSIDLSQASTSSDAEEAVARAPPSNRMRHRAREVRPRFPGHHHHHHHHQHFDPNIATPRQIQELKDKLPSRLPSELADETSKTCDICQKDYSVTYVEPTEEDEVAVELPCGHVFGQFCIFQWFDTCKTHKNKVTCPMCRKLLIEPSRYHPVLLSAISRGGHAFQELLANEFRSDLGYM